jgi:hypothetical protein
MFSDHNLGDDDNEEHTSSGDRCDPQTPPRDSEIQLNENTENENPDPSKSINKQLLTPVSTDLYNKKLSDRENSGFVKAEGYKDNTLRGVEGCYGKEQNLNSKGYNNTSSGNFFGN